MNLPATIKKFTTESVKTIRESIALGGDNVRALKRQQVKVQTALEWMIEQTNFTLSGEMGSDQIEVLAKDLLGEFHNWNLNDFRLMLIFGKKGRYGIMKYKFEYKVVMQWALKYDKELMVVREIIHSENLGNEARVRDTFIDELEKPKYMREQIANSKKALEESRKKLRKK